jgi:hypothetical protein
MECVVSPGKGNSMRISSGSQVNGPLPKRSTTGRSRRVVYLAPCPEAAMVGLPVAAGETGVGAIFRVKSAGVEGPFSMARVLLSLQRGTNSVAELLRACAKLFVRNRRQWQVPLSGARYVPEHVYARFHLA